ncbi:Sugar fermentation stimulation protein A [bioreactor metagenome]|uniref:Sugar fermentation stimulation protein A n=1 Tax=bioreactor metagenome TaxID=1076179 RepID=A0A645AZY5_9ZZZZ
MVYQKMKQAVFIDRPNRFIANIELDGRREVCHVKNTGRCHELLKPGAEIFVQELRAPGRRTGYDLISVWKGNRLINMDSAAPNKVFAEWVAKSGLFRIITLLKPEQRFGNSRFDFYIEADGRRAFAEVKGVTLEEGGTVRFPDAPTERGVKHLHELINCTATGFDAYLVFIVQMKGVKYMEANWATHPAFGEALREADKAGVRILALDCRVTEDSIAAEDYVPVRV